MSDASAPSIPEYRLLLDVDPAALRWSGTVDFDAPPGPIPLDCEGLAVARVRVGDRPVPFHLDPGSARLLFDVPGPGSTPVSIDFSGQVETKNLFGFYRSRQGAAYLLTTHCEPTGARRIFPCVDRPDRKARIVLRVRAPRDLEVIANAPLDRSEERGGRREWRFQPTPEMSTYLFYLGIGRFDLREDRATRVVVRVATPPGRGGSADWALASAGRILAAYETYYGLAYPLPKLDLIAVEEHAFGAMENWGAISFQETRLLIDEASGSFARRDVFETISHEVAHQWFGNLVTMSWWEDIWLNESFASLMETKITDRLEPGLEPWSDFFLRVAGKAAAVDGDSLRVTHPVRAHVERPDEMSQIFDEISYGKGSSILAMLDRYLGEERFRAGVTDYLQRFRYRNARTDDLLEALGRASGTRVAALARPWIDRPGLPLLTADSDRRAVRLRQRRFSYLGVLDEPPWPIPLVVERPNGTEAILFDRPELELPDPDGSFVLLNPGSIGFYRVRYDAALLDRLLTALPSRPARDAWAVVDDLAAFVRSGDADWPTYARAIQALGSIGDRLVVEAITTTLVGFALGHPTVDAVRRTARDYLALQTERIGLDRGAGEPPAIGVARDRLASGRVRVDLDFAAELGARFSRWASVDPDLRAAVAVARARTGGAEGFAELQHALASAPTDAEALRFVRALPWSPEPERVREVLELGSAGKLNRSHVRTVAFQAAANPHARDVTWAWLRDNVDALAALFRGSGYLPLVLEETLPLVGRGRASEVRRFFDGHPVPDGTRGLAKGLERLEIGERLARRLG